MESSLPAAMLIGTLVATALYGVTCYQVFHYLRTYPGDSRWLIALVFAVWAAETGHEILICVTTYSFLVRLNSSVVTGINAAVLIPTEIDGLLVNIFFAYRIRQLSRKHRIWASCIVVLAFTELLVAGGAVVLYHFRQYNQLGKWRFVSITISGLRVTTDIIVMSLMTYLLARERRSLAQRSRVMIDKILTFTVANGAMTGTCAIAMLTLNLKRSTWVYAVYHSVSRIYVNAMLASLNARRAIAESGTTNAVSFGSLEAFPNFASLRDITNAKDGESRQAHAYNPSSIGKRSAPSTTNLGHLTEALNNEHVDAPQNKHQITRSLDVRSSLASDLVTASILRRNSG